VSKQPLKLPTDRSFGFTFAVVFGLVGAWLLWRSSRYGWPTIGAAGAFALIAVTIPRVLHPLNFLWMRFGMLLNLIVSPIVLGVIFYGMLTPIGLLFRATGRDALRRSFDRSLASYWVDRSPPGPEAGSFPRQF
jgi:hypothetical protein